MSLFPFDTLRAIIGGTSAIDLEQLQVADNDSAEHFIESYGYDFHTDEGREEIEQARAQSIAFIEEALLDPSESIPPSVRGQQDVRALLIAVSGPRTTVESLWACAILRVMHTVAHASSDLSTRFGEQIREQILRHFDGHIVERDGETFLGDVPIERFEERGQKSVSSVVMKLLHKPENVAADVFDRVALRFVTRNRLGALLVVRYLRMNHVIQFANIKPARSRNTLVDLDRLEALLADGDLDTTAVAAEIETWPYPDEHGDTRNRFSSIRYHAIQFTCRERVAVPDPAGGVLRFFFPFEIQVMDETSYHASRVGIASHTAYKARQRQACRNRVLRRLLEADV